MVGLSTAWFLQERGVEVTVFDRRGVAAGASWGNAGWLTPDLAIPLPEPAVLRYGLRTILDANSPLYVPFSANPALISFLLRFAGHSTARQWARGMSALLPINARALPAFDLLAAGGVDAPTRPAEPFIAAFRTDAERTNLLDELRLIREAGQPIEFDELTGDEAREAAPALSDEVGAAIRIHHQRFIDPGAYVAALGDAVVARSGALRTGVTIDAIHDSGRDVVVDGDHFDAAVVATGAWMGRLVRPFGVRTLVQAGRGYSFSVPMDAVPSGPLYFPTQRVACTPLGDRMRVAGMMEFRSPEARLDQRRIAAIAEAARPLLRGADLDDRQDEWVGSRPVTPTGLPLIGASRSPRVYLAGGHGMWGITLGPATGELLAEQIVTGRLPSELEPFRPIR